MKTLAYRLQTAALKAVAGIARVLPEKAALALGRILGGIGYHLARYRRGVALANVQRALGDQGGGSEGRRIVRAAFKNLGQTAIELFRFPKYVKDGLKSMVICDSTHLFDRALAEGKGALLLSAHFGNWELYAAWAASLGHPVDIVVKPQRNESADRFYNHLRRLTGVGIIPTQKASKQILVSLKKNRLVAIMADQFAGHDGIPVEFFGRVTSTHHGPAAIALKLGCPIILGVLVRLPDGRHWGICDRLEFEPSGVPDEDIRRLTQKYTRILEGYIRRYPEQWLWMHRRWKDAP